MSPRALAALVAVAFAACKPGGTDASRLSGHAQAGATSIAGASDGDDDTGDDAGGSTTSAGGSPSDAGGSTSATGGSTSGTGGSTSATGGSTSGTGGSTTLAGGSPADGLDASVNVSVIVEPSDQGNGILDAIKNAKQSVHVTIYLLSEDEIIQALQNRREAGLDVSVVLNQTFPAGTTSSNDDAYTRLTNAGCKVAWAPATFQYTHQKTVIIDGTTAWIMTMNLAFSSPTANREYLAIDLDPDDVAEAEAIHQADLAGQSITPTGKLVVAPTNARARLMALLETAKHSVDLEAEELSDAVIVGELASLADAGVTVRVVLADATPSAAQSKAESTLTGHGATVGTLSTPYIHAKAIVVDGARAYVGSANFTANSLDSNRELGLLTETSAVITPVAQQVAADIAAMTKL